MENKISGTVDESPTEILGLLDDNEDELELDQPVLLETTEKTIVNFSESNTSNSFLTLQPKLKNDGTHNERSKIEPKFAAKITMNIPSFLPKIASTTLSVSPKKQQQDKELIKINNSSRNLKTTIAKPTTLSPSSKTGSNCQSGQSPTNIITNLKSINTTIPFNSPNASMVVTLPSTLSGVSAKVRSLPSSFTDSEKTLKMDSPYSQNPFITGNLLHKTIDPLALDNKIFEQPSPITCAENKSDDKNCLSPSADICKAPGCNNTKSASVSLFNMRNDNAKVWCEILGIPFDGVPDLVNFKICAEHFELCEFVENSNMKVLKPNAIPRNPRASQISFAANSLNTLITDKTVVIDQNQNAISKSPGNSFPVSKRMQSPTSIPAISRSDLTTSLQTNQTVPISVCPVTTSFIQPVCYSSLPAVHQQIILPPTECLLPPINSNNDKKISCSSIPSKVSECESGVSSNNRIQEIGVRDIPKPPIVKPANKTSQVPSYTDNRQPVVCKSTIGNTVKFRGPKSQQKLTSSPRNPIVPLGPYARPKQNVLRAIDVKINDLENLVMPNEDWSINVYSSPKSKTGQPVFAISETLLNSDLIEIVRKSITIQPNWAMKFSVMSNDMSHFNLGLGATDISDIQAILDNFDSFVVCKGLTEFSRQIYCSSPTQIPLSIQTQIKWFVDNTYRSISCPLILVGISDKSTSAMCTACLTLMQKFSSENPLKILKIR